MRASPKGETSLNPSDNDLNRAMALACGWQHGIDIQWMEETCDGSAWGNGGWLSPKSNKGVRRCPDYTHNRNTHNEIRDAIARAGAWRDFSHEMRDACIGLPDWENSRTFTVTFAPPRLVVVAALKALGKWEWDGEEGEA